MPMVKGEAVPNIPWEERPAGCDSAVWRSKWNPRDLIPIGDIFYSESPDMCY